MVDKNDVCETCQVYIKKKEELLNSNNSAYDAAIDMMFFIDDCLRTCKKIKLSTGVDLKEEPDCTCCDSCISGERCEYCGPGTNYPNYRRLD